MQFLLNNFNTQDSLYLTINIVLLHSKGGHGHRHEHAHGHGHGDGSSITDCSNKRLTDDHSK